MEIHSRKMVVRSLEEVDAETTRVHLREESTTTAGPGAGPGMGSSFTFPVAREEAPSIGDEITVSANSQ